MINHELYAEKYNINRDLFLNIKDINKFTELVSIGAPFVSKQLALYAYQLVSSQQAPNNFRAHKFFNEKVIHELIVSIANARISDKQKHQQMEILVQNKRVDQDNLNWLSLNYLGNNNVNMFFNTVNLIEDYFNVDIKKDKEFVRQSFEKYCKTDAPSLKKFISKGMQLQDDHELLYYALLSSLKSKQDLYNPQLVDDVLDYIKINNQEHLIVPQIEKYTDNRMYIPLSDFNRLYSIAKQYTDDLDAIQFNALKRSINAYSGIGIAVDSNTLYKNVKFHLQSLLMNPDNDSYIDALIKKRDETHKQLRNDVKGWREVIKRYNELDEALPHSETKEVKRWKI